MNFKLLVAYDGTHYLGWQKTPAGPTVEIELEKALSHLLQEPVILQAASRTDRGVHATGQVVNFRTTRSHFTPEKLLIGLNALLPADIAVLTVQEAEDQFHPTLDVISKEYEYNICCGTIQLPQHRHFSWHFHYPLSIEAMQIAAQKLVGTHDFSAFTNQKKNETYSDHVRTVDAIHIENYDNQRIKILIKGHSFLYKMVRNIVGTLAYVGIGKIAPDHVEKILIEKNRAFGGITAPAHGLTLKRIHYF